MESKISIKENIRDLILDRKNRAIIANSESSRKEFEFLYTFCKDNLEKDAKEIDVILDELSNDEMIILNDMFQGVLNLCRAEWGGDSNPVEIINNPELRKRCSLCNAPNNKWVFNIINKFSGKKMNVGSTCIDQFPSIILREGKTRSQLEREAERKVKLQEITLKIPGIERNVLDWNDRLEKFDILIPSYFENPYIELGKKLEQTFNDFLDGKHETSIFEDIEKILQQKDNMILKMIEYCDEKQNEKFIANREIVNWLKRRNKISIIEKLKETGFVTEHTAPHIHEKKFIENFIVDLNNYCDEKYLGFKISGIDVDKENFIIEPFKEVNIKLSCSFEKFLGYFCWVLFEESQGIPLNLFNVFKVCNIIDKQSVEIIITDLKKLTKGSNFSISIYESGDYDYYQANEIDIIDNKKDVVYVFKLNNFINEYKTNAFGIKNITSNEFIDDLEDFISKSEYKSYTRKGLRELRQAGSEFNKRER